MSFNPPNPIDVSGGYADVSALLQLLIDPGATKQRLDELVAQENATKERIEALNKMADETRRLHNTAQATNIVSDNRKKELDAREAEIEQSESRHSDAAVQKREAAVTRRENLVEARENAGKAEADRLAAMRKDYEAKLGKLKTVLEG
jgi:uncharacterized phage infection (PIP) family protein YhgE